MNAVVQLDMFVEITSVDMLRAEVAALRTSHDAVRKRAFGELRALQKMVMDQQVEIDLLKVKMGIACCLDRK